METKNFGESFHDFLRTATEADLEHVLSDGSFPFFYQFDKQELIDYLVQYSRKIFRSALFLENMSPYAAGKCLSLFSNINSKFYKRLVDETEFMNDLYQYSFQLHEYNARTQNSYFLILTYYLNSTTPAKSFESEEFLRNAVYCIDTTPGYIFVIEFLTKDSPYAKKIRNVLIDLVLEQIIQPSLRQAQAQLIVRDLINGNTSSYVMNKLVQNKVIEQIIEQDKSILFVSFVFLEAAKHYKQNKVLVNTINGYSQNIWERANNHTVYGSTANDLCRFGILLFKWNKNFSEQFKDLVLHLIEDFFEYGTNSFLHNTVLQLFRTLQYVSVDMSQIYRSSNIHLRILDEFRNRPNITNKCYWGQMAGIAEIISPDAPRVLGRQSIMWDAVVMYKIYDDEKIIQKSYGGRIENRQKGRKSTLVVVIAILLILMAIGVAVYFFMEEP